MRHTGWLRALCLVLSLMLNCACTTSNSENAGGEITTQCIEPENPYDEGTGHYAGFEWGQNNGATTCGGSSDSFIEGCEEYQRQESEYAECQATRKK